MSMFKATLCISLAAQWRERTPTQSSITAAGVLLAPFAEVGAQSTINK